MRDGVPLHHAVAAPCLSSEKAWQVFGLPQQDTRGACYLVLVNSITTTWQLIETGLDLRMVIDTRQAGVFRGMHDISRALQLLLPTGLIPATSISARLVKTGIGFHHPVCAGFAARPHGEKCCQ